MSATVYGTPHRTDAISALAGASLALRRSERGRRVAWAVAMILLAIVFVETACLLAVHVGLS